MGWESGNYGQRVKCESQGGSFKICDVATYGYVRLVQQISQSPCVAGRTWGYQANQIWVGEWLPRGVRGGLRRLELGG